jgi:hypothetical protein
VPTGLQLPHSGRQGLPAFGGEAATSRGPRWGASTPYLRSRPPTRAGAPDPSQGRGVAQEGACAVRWGGPCPRSGRLAPPKGGPAPNRLPPLSLRARARAPTFNLVCFFVLALQMPPLGAQRAGGARPQARSPRARPGRLRSCRAPQLRDRGGAQRCVIEWYSALRHYFCWPCQCWLCQSLQLLHLGVLWKCSTYQVPSTCALARVY